MDKNRELLNAFIALALSVLIMFFWHFIFPQSNVHQFDDVNNSSLNSTDFSVEQEYLESRDDALLQSSTRTSLLNDTIEGSLSLKGAILDDLSLKNYKVNTNISSPMVSLLSPQSLRDSRFVEFGWIAKDQIKSIFLPSKDTIWSLDPTSNNTNKTFYWDNPMGVRFSLIFSIDNQYMVSIVQKVLNNTNEEINLSSYALIGTHGDNPTTNGPKTNEGVLVALDKKVLRYDYKKLVKHGNVKFDKPASANHNWVAFSDKYWLTALITPLSSSTIDIQAAKDRNNFFKSQISFVTPLVAIKPGEVSSVSSSLFLGAKELSVLDYYASQKKIVLFDRALDFGMLYFITRPLLLLLQFLQKLTHNFGVSILILTVLVKSVMFPLTIKTYISGQKMRILQPKIRELQDRHSGDKMQLNLAMMRLFKEQKTNPLSGCLPLFIQIPVFFALYKVLIVSISMRHAPFFYWIKDLSVPDPINIFILFKYLNINFFNKLSIGILPILLTVTMILQQKFTNGVKATNIDPSQEKVIKMMPYLFLFVFASFPAGLLIYWIWSNMLSILQHFLMLKLHKVK
ncbi:Membrane protein insertase YidC [Candidatus Xenohaliotis californiensis]|uniref:Membrane protein insertase YidC n=1 Tax=Candidatus Xenohaliotis californiensis TaxID=84677 RepID=A0ABM9N903_9RICK|nr:Membrane protein insertase YidC [Candidatus Xenohaliotis californiensis]